MIWCLWCDDEPHACLFSLSLDMHGAACGVHVIKEEVRLQTSFVRLCFACRRGHDGHQFLTSLLMPNTDDAAAADVAALPRALTNGFVAICCRWQRWCFCCFLDALSIVAVSLHAFNWSVLLQRLFSLANWCRNMSVFFVATNLLSDFDVLYVPSVSPLQTKLDN